MFVMACLIGFTLNIVEAFETTYTMMIAFYVGVFSPDSPVMGFAKAPQN